MGMHDKTIYKVKKAPAPIGPYSVATGGGPFVFTSGQIGIDPGTGALVPGGIEEQTRQVLENLKGILEETNSCLKNAIKTTVYLRDMNDFARMNAIYAEYFPDNPPVRTTVAVSGLPKDALVEIDVISVLCLDQNCC